MISHPFEKQKIRTDSKYLRGYLGRLSRVQESNIKPGRYFELWVARGDLHELLSAGPTGQNITDIERMFKELFGGINVLVNPNRFFSTGFILETG